ncbi:alpha/beta fold hydrolase [Cryobacterium sp. TMT1-21]|uniref:alpha/beta hydrolase n=1 Tax=unclassified Cryobacterium TaxID=2649013 RepID=UPI00106BE7EE|nr:MULTISPECIES: alpha/beta fold hydrolase [unclassified Cryobacterium]TFC89431.1 alpha/beta fold hydrolase [Cryobacterium sp. TmT2-59]TFD13668.1 alpha/beta fold hydrolase [Cryobacterium sp. TMT4-10]TFD15969.1 alpha/beta fold hydrolase [Cryobacterium sp. TMT1-21]TFD19817.1 alpha/beta fold hydrolase [Cryobacterium sp. TMT2-23]TFD38304.1 alpha/beta fold hydrolase [Cryobacterium sp. TMT2-10]
MRAAHGRAESAVKVIATAGLIVAGVGVAAGVGISALMAVMARRIVTPSTKSDEDVRVYAVDLAAGTIALQSTPDSVLRGDYSFWFSASSGHAHVGEILRQTSDRVTRRILRVDYGDLAAAVRGRLAGYSFLGPWDLGVEFEDVSVPTGAGEAPAWLVVPPEPDGRWVIQVHGRGVQRQETLRAVPVFRSLGYTSLLVSYRNDGEAPGSADGRYSLGDTEWLDIEAAIAFAAGRGATEIVLMGWSMGGAIVLQAATRSMLRHLVVGIVLDSPVIDWADVARFQGGTLGLPAVVASGALEVLGRRWGGLVTGQAGPIDFARLDFVTRAAELDLPVLLMHSDDDGYVPATGSRALAERRPDIVTFLPFAVARHTKLWNYDREGWNQAITNWLGEISPTGRTSHPDRPAGAAEG